MFLAGPPPGRAAVTLLLCAAVLLGHLSPVSAYDFEITSRTEAYGYQLRRYFQDGIQFLNRRRVHQWLGLRVFNLLEPGQEPWSPRGRRAPALLTVHAQVRLDTEFGSYGDREAGVPEVERSDLDLLPTGIEGRGLFGWLDLDLGRQIDMELMSFFAFDGLRLRANLPLGFYVEAAGGLQVAGAHPFSSAVFETEGTPGDPSRQAWSPTYAVAGGLEGGPGELRLRLAYRGVTSRAEPAAAPGRPPGAPLWGIDEEVLFFAAQAELPWLRLRPQIGLRYNLLTAQLDDLELALSLCPWHRLEIHLELLRSRPHFDGDSILNLFSLEPTSDLLGRFSLQILPRLSLGLRLGYRWFWSDPVEGPTTREPGVITAGLVGRWSGPRLRAELEGYYQGGEQGSTGGADLDGGYRVLRWLELEGRASLLGYQDRQQRPESLVAFGLQAGLRFDIVRGVLLNILLEDNVSRLYRSALRLLAVVDLEFAP